MLYLSDLCGLSECNERARGKACVSRKDAKNAEKSGRQVEASLDEDR